MFPGSGCPVPESLASGTASAVSKRVHEGADASPRNCDGGGSLVSFGCQLIDPDMGGRRNMQSHLKSVLLALWTARSGLPDIVSCRPSISGMLFSCVGSLRCTIAPRTLSTFRRSSLGLPRECCRTGGAMTFMLQCLFRRPRASARWFAPALSGSFILSRFFPNRGRSFWSRQFYSRSTSLR